MNNAINTEIISSWESQLKAEQLTLAELERAYYLLSTLKDCEGHLVDFTTLMLIKSGIELVRWSIKPLDLTFETVLDYARGKKISVFYDTHPGNVKAGEL